MPNPLVDIIKKGDRDALNAYLTQQTVGSDAGGMSLDGVPNNALTALVRGQPMQRSQPEIQPQPSGMQPINTIRTSSGQYLSPTGERTNAPVQFGQPQAAPSTQTMQATIQPRQNDPYAKARSIMGMMAANQGMPEQNFIKQENTMLRYRDIDKSKPVNVDGDTGYMQPDGSIVGGNEQAGWWEAKKNPTTGMGKSMNAMLQGELGIAMKEAENQQRLQDVAINRSMQQQASMKPVFNADAGGYVYPPSPENPQGKFVPVSGFAAGGNKPLTEFQGKAALFGSRAAAASDLIDKVGPEESGAAKTLQYWQDVPLAGRAANAMASPQAQSLAQAQRDFVNAVMRLESGATISPAEFANATQQYFPQPGDSPQVIAQKKNNREMAIEGLSKLAGPSGGEFVKTQRAAAMKTGGLTGGNSVTAPDGSVHNFPNAAAADAFRKAIGM